MKLLSVNLGVERPDPSNNGDRTGIYKFPASGAVQVQALGLPGDVVCDQKHHGGPDQAVYIYGGGDYAWWASELGKELEPGTFGENLTISELESGPCCAGDRLLIGPVILEVTAPRIPCGTFAARMGDPAFVKRFRLAERPGLYCRVIQEGSIQAGDPVIVQSFRGESISIAEMFHAYYEAKPDADIIRRHLNAPISIRARRDWLEKQAKLKV